MQLLQTIASTTESSEESASLLSALGIDWALLVQQALAFLILVLILAKFVYPALIKSVESRRDQIESATREAKEAEEKLVSAEEKVGGMLADARKEADDIIARSAAEANRQVAAAEEKARERAEQIVADAHTQLDADIRRAREALKKETIELVALATGKIVEEKLDSSKDAKLIEKALKERV